MKRPQDKKIIFRGKSNRFLFICRTICHLICYSIGTIAGILMPTLFFSGIAGFICNDGKLNQPILLLGISLIPIIIICRIIYLIWLRKNQFYIITIDCICSKGGVFNKFEQKIRIADIRGINCQRSLIQQLTGCGNIVISTAAATRGIITLKNIDNPQHICHMIEEQR